MNMHVTDAEWLVLNDRHGRTVTLEQILQLRREEEVEQTCLEEIQRESEELFHRNQLLPRLRSEFSSEEEVMAMVDAVCPTNWLVYMAVDLLAHLVLHRQCDMTTMVGILRRHVEGANLAMPEEDYSQHTADWIVAFAEAGLCDYDPGTGRLIMVLDVSDDVHEDLARYQYPLPLVVPPLEVTDSMTTGYHRFRKGSVVLRDNHHDGDFCLDHLNRMNAIPLALDERVCWLVRNTWKNLDRRKEDETEEEFQERRKAFQRYDEHAHDVFDRMGLLNGNRFWLVHRYDKRGRTYCQGYYATYQGNAWNKACVVFANEEVTE